MNDDFTAANGSPESELHAMAWAGDIQRVQALLDEGVNVNFVDSIQEAALHGAAAWGHLEVVQLLLRAGADPNLENNEGNTPIHWACSHGTEQVLAALVEAGGKLLPSGTGESPINIAKNYNNHGVIAWLKKNT